jgi:hypothetical protein
MTVADPRPRLMAKRVLSPREWTKFDSYPLFDQVEEALKREGIQSVFRPERSSRSSATKPSRKKQTRRAKAER